MRRSLPFLLVLAALGAAAAPCPNGLVWREGVPSDLVCVTTGVRERTQGENARGADRHEAGPGASGTGTCRHGFVWRGAFPGDLTCVEPAGRDQAAVDNRDSHSYTSAVYQRPDGTFLCKQGYVWRAARPEDVVCVTPQRREQVRQENALAPQRTGNDICLQSFVWRGGVEGDTVCVTPQERQQAARDNACSLYALDAVAMYRLNLERHCGFGNGARWTDDAAGHFNWCVGVSAGTSDSEAQSRRNQLCPPPGHGPNPNPNPGPPHPPGGGTQCCFEPTGTPGGVVWAQQCGPVCPCGPGRCQ